MLEGDSAVISFDSPGTYVFFCSFHGNAEGSGMAGTIIVGDSG
jgi:plastocyanin